MPIKSYCGHTGDSYDRFLIRMLEMGESLRLVNLVSLKLLNTQDKYTNYSLNITQKIFTILKNLRIILWKT